MQSEVLQGYYSYIEGDLYHKLLLSKLSTSETMRPKLN